MAPLSVVCFKWKPAPNYRSKFEGVHVNALHRMVNRYYTDPHRFICITDDPAGIDPEVEVIPLWDTFRNLKSPHGPKNPCCYPRLRLFAKDAGELVGERFVWVDLDTVIVNDVRPLWNRTEDFIIWRSAIGGNYCGSMVMNRTGTRTCLWDEFDPVRTPKITMEAGHFGSDQAWIAHRLGPKQATWTLNDGVYSYRLQIRKNPNHLPPNARIVFHHGAYDPWSPEMARIPFVRKHYLPLMNGVQQC